MSFLPGGVPTNTVDTPIAVVLIMVYVGLAATHLTIRRRTHLETGENLQTTMLIANFCITRINALVMRIVWANWPHNKDIMLAATVFLGPGVDLLFVCNLIYAHRVWLGFQSRTHPRFVRPAKWILCFVIFTVAATVIYLLTFTIISFLTTDKELLLKNQAALKVGLTFFAVHSFLPLPVAFVAAALPRPGGYKHFGAATLHTKFGIVAASSALLCLSAAWRCGTTYLPLPVSGSAWWHHKACFFIFNFVVEAFVVILFAVARVDKMFFIPASDDTTSQISASDAETERSEETAIGAEWEKGKIDQ